ncbi:MAG: phosphoribosylaminoimidazolesuccinocarboxamide synthase [Gammaproteobacteria bacterium]|nr:phosphoribosylaminoimidazolesuccinocarboxamide synthase [Gammaproteobacteria bacterium]
MSPTAEEPALFESHLTGLNRISQGKVRDIYEVDADHLLIVTTDRLSAFDVVLPTPIPGKGEVLTQLSNFWFARMQPVVANHLTGRRPEDVLSDPAEQAMVARRAIVVRRLKPLPVEAVVRGYLIGSGWKDYQASGAVCGIPLPKGLPMAAQLPEPIFTPATKAEIGQHDENISFAGMEKLVGSELARKVRELSIGIYTRGAEYARSRGIIIADTKFEFGLDEAGRLYLIDEVLTPDSSRFWPAAGYRTGISPPSFDKQYVRDYLETLDWDKKAPGPALPAEVIRRTSEKYRQALEILARPG